MTTKILAVEETTCQRCEEPHALIACPFVKAAEFDAAGNMTRVEFLTPADYQRQRVEEPEADYPRKPTAN